MKLFEMDAHQSQLFIKELLENCSDYVARARAEIKTNKTPSFLVHTINNSNHQKNWKPYGSMVTRDDRPAKDSGMGFQNDVDAVMKARGFKAIRSNSLFAYKRPDGNMMLSSSRNIMLFPANDANITFSSTRDLYQDLMDTVIHSRIEENMPEMNFSEEFLSAFYTKRNSVTNGNGLQIMHDFLSKHPEGRKFINLLITNIIDENHFTQDRQHMYRSGYIGEFLISGTIYYVRCTHDQMLDQILQRS